MQLRKPFFVRTVVRVVARRIDPDCGRHGLGFGTSEHEPLRMFRRGRLQCVGAIRDDFFSFAVVQQGGCPKSDSRRVVLVVVPLEKRSAKTKPLFVAAKPIRELGALLPRLELAFGKRVVVRYVRSTVRLDDAERRPQGSHTLRCHRGSPIAVGRALIFAGALLFPRLAHHTRCQAGAPPRGGDPANPSGGAPPAELLTWG